ncbi:MAG: hypothetical protein HOG76_11950 [Candidatus Marinimicrobia bacterium]|nr:hypothetical protein [Candidatus Neomarinimicrobiota bacterium]
MTKFIKFLTRHNWDKSKYSNDLMVRVAQTGHRIDMDPSQGLAELTNFDNEWLEVLEMLNEASAENDLYKPYLELLKTAD